MVRTRSSLLHRRPRTVCAALALLVLPSACATLPRAGAEQQLSNAERINHVLNRFAYGPRPGDAERVAAIGIERWIDEQLRPELIPDNALDLALSPLTHWNVPAKDVPAVVQAATMIAMRPRLEAMRAGLGTSPDLAYQSYIDAINAVPNQFKAGKIIRAETSERQLLEVMTDFWENHFSVFIDKMPSRTAIVE